MRKWKFGDVQSAVMHIAYAVPEGNRFTSHDCVKILDMLQFDTSKLGIILSQLRVQNVLLQKYDTSLFESTYFLERRSREAYCEDLKKVSKDPEPEKREISQELRTLAARVMDIQESSFLNETMTCLAAGG